MNYITPFDDYPIHQAIEPITIPGPTDRNFYDRYFFNGMDPENGYIFEIGIGIYPNRHIIDGHFSISYQGKQYSFHASQRLDQNRVPINIGPMQLTIDQPMNELTFSLKDPDNKLNCNLKFSANSVAHQEPRSLMMEGTRTIMNTIRFTQLGKWTGEIETEAGTLNPESIYGIRDRSWGVRPIGEQEGGAPGMLNQEPGVYWCWAPVHFDSFCTQFGTFEDRDGNTTQISGHKLPLYDDMSSVPSNIEVETIHSLRHSVTWQKGSRWATGAKISGMLKNKEKFDLELETMGPIFFCKGIGYQHDEWKHGIWKGESETGYEVWDLATIDPADYTFFHTHQIAKAKLGSEQGIGMLENLVVGRHDPSGFEDFLMEQNKFKKCSLTLICFFIISGCQIDLIETRNISLNKIEFGLSVNDSFRKKSLKYFTQDQSKDNYNLKISKLQFKKKNFYGGFSARAKQIEIIGELEYIFSKMSSSKNGKLQISGWIPVNENNPQAEMMAQQKTVEELEFLLLEDLLEEYLLIES